MSIGIAVPGQQQHPGPLLAKFIEHLLVHKKEAANHLGISRATLFRVISEEGRITVDIAMRLERAFHVPAGYWLQRQAEYDIAQARASREYEDIRGLKAPSDARDALALAERTARIEAQVYYQESAVA